MEAAYTKWVSGRSTRCPDARGRLPRPRLRHVASGDANAPVHVRGADCRHAVFLADVTQYGVRVFPIGHVVQEPIPHHLIRASPFAYQADFPLLPGEYKLSVILRLGPGAIHGRGKGCGGGAAYPPPRRRRATSSSDTRSRPCATRRRTCGSSGPSHQLQYRKRRSASPGREGVRGCSKSVGGVQALSVVESRSEAGQRSARIPPADERLSPPLAPHVLFSAQKNRGGMTPAPKCSPPKQSS